MVMLAIIASGPAQEPEPETPPTYTVLHTFAGGVTDGANPFSGLMLDRAGNLFGTTQHGGASGNGVVFKLTSSGTETVLHSFAGPPADGAVPLGGLIRDGAGNLYGTTNTGGASGNGIVFKLTPSGTETVLHSFAGFPTDGAGPEGDLIRDAAGNLYGTTRFGGTNHNCGTGGCGTIFKVTPSGTETVLYSFSGPDGKEPLGGLVRDAAGNFYGTTGFGGAFNGDVFELTSGGIESVLHSFAGHPTDGTIPRGDLIRDSAGNLYGTTGAGGASNNCGSVGCGTIFKLTASGSETVLHSFTGQPKDGSFPTSNLVRDRAGNLFGTTQKGGASGFGVVFKLTP